MSIWKAVSVPEHSEPVSVIDRRLIDATIRLGRSGLGRTWPNPSVGTLIVQFDDTGWPIIVGRGVTGEGGRPHAEEIALEAAGEAARGATVYVSLEPCAHRNRPHAIPCANLLSRAGVARVVAAVQDPNPSVHGRGFDHLRAVDTIVVDDVARLAGGRAHAGHITRMTAGRPHVTLKLALTADGMIGRVGAGQVAITGAEARRRVHMMRAQTDAILVGVGTVAADDPMLDCRLPGMAASSPVRVVLDTYARMSPESALAKTAHKVPTWLITAPIVDQNRLSVLSGCRIELLQSAITVGPREDRINTAKAFKLLGDRGITRLLVEGGSRVAADLLKAGLVDDIALFRSNVRLGDGGVPALAHGDLDAILRREFDLISVATCGADVLQSYSRAI